MTESKKQSIGNETLTSERLEKVSGGDENDIAKRFELDMSKISDESNYWMYESDAGLFHRDGPHRGPFSGS